MNFYEHKNCLALRKAGVEDLPALLALKNESWFGTVQTACLNMTDQQKWFEKVASDKSCIYFMILDGSTPIGVYGITNIDWINQSCDFSHSVIDKYRGQGFGRRSLRAGIDMTFEVFNMRRIETWILSNNIAEIRTVIRVGFTEEGVKRKAVYKCGEYLDCKLFGLLRSEWDVHPTVAEYRGKTGICNRNYVPKNNDLPTTS